ncbi:MAG: phytoene/squalene synthase family protein [Desulfobacterales bacterium]|nr:MAG: phytoene/squalene synthase family protein [Desulfobacterales bacterium]
MRSPNSLMLQTDIEQQILQGVSRSFALTIPQLPRNLCRTVRNAYLLCRIVDTIEDEVSLSIDQKRTFFHEFIDVVNGNLSADKFAAQLYPLLCNKTLTAEKELIQNTPIVIRTLFSFSKAQQSVLRRCVKVMATGMLKFQEIKSPNGLKSLSHMSSYCYHVAGVVGEMLTDLFCGYSEDISKNRENLISLAASFGQGLQMTNILKDLWEDKKRGACWLPQDVFNDVGFDLKNLTAGAYSPTFSQGLAELIGLAHAHLKNALSYTLLIPRHETGIRKFCLWAIGMAILTLQNINKTRNYTSGGDVKISRKSSRMVILVSNTTLRSNALLKMFFKIATRGLPAANSIKPSLGPAISYAVEDLPLKYQSSAD